MMIGKGRNEWGGWGQEVGGALQAKVKALEGGGGGGGVVEGLCHLLVLLLQILLLILFYLLVIAGGFQFHHPLLFFSFFAVVGYLNYIFIRLRYLSNDIFLLMYIMLLNKLT